MTRARNCAASIGRSATALIEERPFTEAWPGGGPWRPGIQAVRGGEDRD